MENMREYLTSLNSSEPLFLGRRFHGFLSGGPGWRVVHHLCWFNRQIRFETGYLLTRETMRRLVEKGLDQNVCNTTIPGSADDVIIGIGILSASSNNEIF